MNTARIYVLQALSGAAALAAATATLAGADIMVQQFDMIDLGPSFRLVAGVIEFIAGLTLIIPRTGALGAVILVCLMIATAGASLGHMAALRPVTERASLPISHTFQDLLAREHGAANPGRKTGMQDI